MTVHSSSNMTIEEQERIEKFVSSQLDEIMEAIKELMIQARLVSVTIKLKQDPDDDYPQYDGGWTAEYRKKATE